MNYTYLLKCADHSLYCGWTNHLEERVAAHNAGKGAKYTKGRGPVELAYFECFATKEEAMKREAAIKRLTRGEKEALISCAGKEQPDGGGQRPFRMIVSPAKKMTERPDELPWNRLPVCLSQTRILLKQLKAMSEAELKVLFQANDKITHENYLRYLDMDLERNLTPALLTYVGIQYQYMAPRIFSGAEWDYVCRNLRILSGFYGILRADDGIVPYRLELQAGLRTKEAADLYGFWKDQIYRELVRREDGQSGFGARILNLASREYSRAVEPYLRPEDTFVTCIFGSRVDGKVKVKATEAKMARGEMVRFLAESGAEDFEQVKRFDRLGFSFCAETSTETEFVFIKGEEK